MARLLAMFGLILGLIVVSGNESLAQPVIQGGDMSDPGERIVSLSDGSIFRGELLEYVPQRYLALRLASGQVLRFEWVQIKRIVLAHPANSTPGAAPQGTSATSSQRPVARAASSPASAPTDEVAPERAAAYREHFRRAKEFYEDEQFSKALTEFDTAYRLWPKSAVLYLMARAHHQLGHYREAYDKYQIYLAKEPNIPEEQRAQIQAYIAELNAAAQQERVRIMGPDPFATPQPQAGEARFVYRRRTDMLVAGAVLLPVAYAAALGVGALGLVGSATLTGSYSESTLSSARWALGTLFIPVLGPFVSAGIVQDIRWSLPWILVDGAAQVAGLALIIAGSRKHRVPGAEARVTFFPYRSPNSTGMVLAGTF